MTPLQKAVEEAIELLGEWLTENTVDLFEEEPEIDTIRAQLDEALHADLEGK